MLQKICLYLYASKLPLHSHYFKMSNHFDSVHLNCLMLLKFPIRKISTLQLLSLKGEHCMWYDLNYSSL